MSSCLVTLKNPQPDTTLDNMVNDASKSKSSYFHDLEPNNENNNEYDDNIWEMEYDDDINNILYRNLENLSDVELIWIRYKFHVIMVSISVMILL
ncbi:uncharacterized protein OCT59_001232 [Rhizophagus irregularis]|nr:hypothetical protein OCT59_001232 [Rhizophagus irregularis]